MCADILPREDLRPMTARQVRLRAGQRFALAALAAFGLLLALPGIAGAADPYYPPFGPNDGGTRFSDNSSLSWRSIECTDAHHLHFNHFVYYTMHDDFGPTDLSLDEKPWRDCGSADSQDDIYWFATAQSNLSTSSTVGDWTCTNTSGVYFCDSGRMRWSESTYSGATNATKWNIACHEIAHAVGFEHGSGGNNCMDGGNNGILDSYMRSKINDHY